MSNQLNDYKVGLQTKPISAPFLCMQLQKKKNGRGRVVGALWIEEYKYVHFIEMIHLRRFVEVKEGSSNISSSPK